MSLNEQVALMETANAALKSEADSMRSKLLLANAEIDRLTADNESLATKLNTYITATARMQTLIDSAGVLLIEGKKTGNALQGTPVPQNTLSNDKGEK